MGEGLAMEICGDCGRSEGVWDGDEYVDGWTVRMISRRPAWVEIIFIMLVENELGDF